MISAAQTRWKPPIAGIYKVNVDGPVCGNRGGIGVIIRDHLGELIATLADPVDFVLEPKHVEAVAVAKGIEFAVELALPRFSMETDCLEVVKWTHSEDEDLSATGHLIETIRKSIKNLSCIGLDHCRRDSNAPAHSLAKFTCNLTECKIWIEEGPDCIFPAILTDQFQ